MTDFGGLVTDINKGTGNGGTQQTHDDDWFRNTFLPTIGRYVESRVKPLRQRVDELERKTKNWEYRGVFESGEAYYENNFTTHHGSLWICQRDTSSIPGTDDTWQLCTKRGKDAR